MVRITGGGLRQIISIIISSSPTGKNMRLADSALGIFRSPDPGLCVPHAFCIPEIFFFIIVLGFSNTSTLVDHFVLSPRKREKRDRRNSRGEEREGQGRKVNRNESEETEEIKTFPLYPYLLQG